MDPNAILHALADLAPAAGERVYDVTRGGPAVAWLGRDRSDWVPRNRATMRLAAVDALHRDERVLRRGWGFVIGAAEVNGGRRRVLLPLLAEPIRLDRRGGGFRVTTAGDAELTPFIDDPDAAARLEAAAGIAQPGWLATPEAAQWVSDAARAAGLPVADVDPTPPRSVKGEAAPARGVVAAGLFVVREALGAGPRDALRAWAARPGLAGTALAAVYADAPAFAAEPSTSDDEPVRSPLPLNAAQREVVRRARREPVVVVAGPPGNGKSHTVVATAMDAVRRGGSVLVATQSRHAADVLGELLARYPGPNPVLFGDAERREELVAALGEGPAGVPSRQLRADAATVRGVVSRADAVAAAIRLALTEERSAASLERWLPALPGLAVVAPAAIDGRADLARAAALVERLATPTTAWSGRLVAAWRWWVLRRLVGARADAGIDQVSAAVEAGRAQRSAARLAATGGTDLTEAWRALAAAEEEVATAVGVEMRHHASSSSRWTSGGRRAASGLAAALRAGRNRRRQMLAGLDGAALVGALPLWVGTVTDVEDLLPPVPGMFDLVILDEAAHTDQIRAAPVLARARRAMVVGDPRQLRFVSFVSDVDVADTLRRHGLDDRVDVRRLSTFDVASGSAAVSWLDQHYRSAPHLIEFSAKRFYGGRMALVTRHPRNEATDVIDVVRVDGAKLRDGVNDAEVESVIAMVRELAGAGMEGIGVITPFRAQADALEAALIGAFDLAEIERLRLRVGTVHAYQGSESEVVVASLGLVDGDTPARTRFGADAHLFNVMVTRARRRMIVVTSLRDATGIVGDYLRYSEAPPVYAPPPGNGAGPAGEWAAALAAEFGRAGVPARPGYQVGNWVVDLCVGTGGSAVGLLCGVHPQGPDAHIERHRELTRAGWNLVDAYPSRWGANAPRAAVDLTIGGTASTTWSTAG
jgi:hypothetical protein